VLKVFFTEGEYFQVRHFLSALLTQLPPLSLDAVQCQKPNSGGALETRITLSHYVTG